MEHKREAFSSCAHQPGSRNVNPIVLKGAVPEIAAKIIDGLMIFECRNITYQYPHSQSPVFNKLSFKLQAPGFSALFGPSGVGKTSLARIISGDITEFSGSIRHNGVQNVLYSYNLERLPGWSSVGSHIDKIVLPSRKPRCDELIETFGLEDHMHARFSRLSLGQQNRINLLRYLLQDFQMLIMDESLANVDEMTREKIILKIKDLYPNVYFLYISHNVIEVSKYCKDIVVFRSSSKSPQTVVVEGLDHRTGRQIDRERLELTMLEIMNAAA